MDGIRSKKRVKDLGEVFTPIDIVNEMLDLIPDKEWKDPSFTVFEPSCGSGNFLVGIIDKKLDNGSTPLQALNTTFGVDICQDNINESRDRILELVACKMKMCDRRTAICIIYHNISLGDFLKDAASIRNKPFFMNTKKITKQKGCILSKTERRSMENIAKKIDIPKNFNTNDLYYTPGELFNNFTNNNNDLTSKDTYDMFEDF